MKSQGKWSGALRFGAHDGALLRSPITDDTPYRTHDAAPADWGKAEAEAEALGGPNAHHTHIWLSPSTMAPAQPAPPTTRQTVRDAAAPVRRPRDQGDPAPGSLLCKISQNGQSGQWSGTDAAGRPLVIKRGSAGFDVCYAGGSGEESDPDTIAAQAPSPVARDANAGSLGELTPGRVFEARMSAALAPNRDTQQRNPSGLRGLQALLTSHYTRKT